MEWFANEALPAELSTHQVRQLHSEVRKAHMSIPNPEKNKNSKILVIEAFSPPRFKTECEGVGFQARSIDL